MKPKLPKLTFARAWYLSGSLAGKGSTSRRFRQAGFFRRLIWALTYMH